MSKLGGGECLREHIKLVWAGGTNSNADTCLFFIFFLKTCKFRLRCRELLPKLEAERRGKGHRPPHLLPSPDLTDRRLSEHIGVDAEESNTRNQVQKQRERESDHKPPPPKKSSLGLLRLIGLILWAFSGISPSHEQPGAAGQGAGPWSRGPTEDLVKAVRSLCLETRHHRHPHHTSPCVTAGRCHNRLTFSRPERHHLLQQRNRAGLLKALQAPVGAWGGSVRHRCVLSWEMEELAILKKRLSKHSN